MEHILAQAARYGSQVSALDETKQNKEALEVFKAFTGYRLQFVDDPDTYISVGKAYWNGYANN